MRPSNLKEVASSVVKGMSRSINRSAQPTEDQTRYGRRKGSRNVEVYDWDGIDFEAIAGELEKLGEDPWELNFDEIYDLAESKGLTPDNFTREGSRKGSKREEVIDEVFDGDEILYNEYLDEMGEYGLANWSIDTWKEYFEKYEMGLDPEGEDKFLEAHRNGSRNGSRKGMDVDGYFNVVAGNHGLDIAKAIKVRDEMNEEGILPDTEEFVELSKKHGVDPDIMQNVVDDFAERYLM